MGHYTKKPVTIEALRWDGVTLDGAPPAWLREALAKDPQQPGAIIRVDDTIHVHTTEGVMIASPGDWIICGVEGELYPCKDSDFQATYRKGGERGPVLMSPENPTGWKLEELLQRLRVEVKAKCAKISGDDRPVARAVLRNNEQILGLLRQAEALQRDSYDRLNALAPDQGPSGTPRIGVGAEAP